jgi:hypothetical protein
MKRIVVTERLISNDLASLQAALTKMIGAARMACNGQDFGGASTIHVEDEDGWNITGVALVEEILSDKSRVYNAQLLFGELSEPLNKMANATARRIKRGNRKICF